MDGLTWAVIGAFALFWGLDGVQMLRRKITLSKLIGEWEKGDVVRHLLIGATMLFLTLHLEFFP